MSSSVRSLILFLPLFIFFFYDAAIAGGANVQIDTTGETGITKVSDIIDTAGFERPEYLEQFRLKQPGFTYSIDMVSRFSDYDIISVSFPSEMKTDLPENNTVYLSYYRPRGIENMPCAIIIGHLGGRFIMSRIAARMLVEKKLAPVIIHLPYFGKREKKNKRPDR